MSSSYAFQILRLDQKDRELFSRPEFGCSANTRKHPCHSSPEFECTYRYVTGSTGRTTTARRTYCLNHATKFADSHNLTIPQDPAIDSLDVSIVPRPAPEIDDALGTPAAAIAERPKEGEPR